MGKKHYVRVDEHGVIALVQPGSCSMRSWPVLSRDIRLKRSNSNFQP
jgi:hypothetical protein